MPAEAFPKRSEYWLAKAEEARTIGEGMRDPVAAAAMDRVAQSYGHLARLSAAREEQRSEHTIGEREKAGLPQRDDHP